MDAFSFEVPATKGNVKLHILSHTCSTNLSYEYQTDLFARFASAVSVTQLIRIAVIIIIITRHECHSSYYLVFEVQNTDSNVAPEIQGTSSRLLRD